MSYRKLINSNLKKAFRLLGDLIEEVTFTGKSEEGFDFATKTVKGVDKTPVTLKAVVVKDDRTNRSSPVNVQGLMFHTADMPDVKTFDRVEIAGTFWQIGDSLASDKYITFIEIYRKGDIL